MLEKSIPANAPQHVHALNSNSGQVVSINIGPLGYRLESEQRHWLSPLINKLDVSDTPHISRTLTIVGDNDVCLPPEPAGWIYDIKSTFGAEQQTFVGPEFILEFELNGKNAICRVDPRLEERFYIRPIENALRILVAYDVLLKGGVLLHSAGIVTNDSATIFVGQSGAGKSTLCKTSLSDPTCTILSDELNILLPTANDVTSYSMPFAGDFGGKGSSPYPVKRIAAIGQAQTSDMVPANPLRILTSLCANAPFTNGNPFVLDLLLSNINSALKKVDCVSMKLKMGDTPWHWN